MAAQTVSKEKQTAEALVMKLKKKLGSYYEREGLKARVRMRQSPTTRWLSITGPGFLNMSGYQPQRVLAPSIALRALQLSGSL
jgi:hypothetical protein